MEGKVFGLWTVLERCPREPNDKGAVKWMCRCNCGTLTAVNGKNLRNGSSTSCGCLNRLVPLNMFDAKPQHINPKMCPTCEKRKINPKKHTKVCEACYKKLVRRIKDPLVGTRGHARAAIKFLLTGLKFGHWSIGEPTLGKKGVHLSYHCTCDCGIKAEVDSSALRGGTSTGCEDCRARKQRLAPFEAEYNRAARNIKAIGKWTMDISYEEFLEFAPAAIQQLVAAWKVLRKMYTAK